MTREVEMQEVDWTAFPKPSEELQSSWLLQHSPRLNKKTTVRKRTCAWTLAFVGIVLVTALMMMIIALTHHRHHYQQQPSKAYKIALHTGLKFFNSQRSGHLPDVNNVSWRGDSCLHDGEYPGNPHPHLSGGYYDGGDAIKSNFKMSFAMTMLSWSVIQYHSTYQQLGELNHVKGIIKWGTDYFLKTFDSSGDTIHDMVSQVERAETERYCWMRPEDIDYKRHVDVCISDCPSLAAEMAAALASASIVFSENVEYSQRLIHGAKILYKYAESSSMNTDSNSSSDEMLWSGAWLYYATGEASFLDRVITLALSDSFSSDSGFVFSWNTKLAGTQLLLTRMRLFLSPGYPAEEVLRKFHTQISVVMCSYLPYFNKFNRTKGGLIQLTHGDPPQPLQYAANAAFLASLYSDYLDASDTRGWSCGPNSYLTYVLRDFSRSQIDYILGKNPENVSYVVGFGERYPKQVHHRGASIPKNRKESCQGGWKWRDSSKSNPNVIEGAMVAGPDEHDVFHDVRSNSNYTEPTLTGNAGLVAALVALSGEQNKLDKNGMFSAIPPLFSDAPPPPSTWTP